MRARLIPATLVDGSAMWHRLSSLYSAGRPTREFTVSLHRLENRCHMGHAYDQRFRTTNQTFAGRSARRRTYQGNQFAP